MHGFARRINPLVQYYGWSCGIRGFAYAEIFSEDDDDIGDGSTLTVSYLNVYEKGDAY
jgi:hypothetical protein